MTGPVAPARSAGPRRPVSVALASVLLIVMGAAGLVYAVVALAITPSTVDAFRDASTGSAATPADVDDIVGWLWWAAGLGLLVAVLLFALLVALGLGVRRGSRRARTGTFVASGLGLFCGCGAALTTAIQRAAPFDLPGSGLGAALAGAYPDGWIWLNVALAGAQMVGYVVVAVLLIAAPGSYFDRAGGTPQPFAPQAFAPPSYGPPGSAAGPSPYGRPGLPPPASAPAEPPPPHDDRWAPPSG